MDTCDLRLKKCCSCEGIGRALTVEEAVGYQDGVPLWLISEDAQSISRVFVMKDFLAAVHLVDRIAQLAESEGHHPDIHLTKYRHLLVELSTHALDGLTENDFIVAAKIDALTMELKG